MAAIRLTINRHLAGMVAVLPALAGCSGVGEDWSDLLNLSVKESKPVTTSLRPATPVAVPEPSTKLTSSKVSVRIRDNDTRLQLQVPLLPATRHAGLRLVARSYWFPDHPMSPEGKLYFELNIPLTKVKPPASLVSTAYAESAMRDGQSRIRTAIADNCDLAAADGGLAPPSCKDPAVGHADGLLEDWHAHISLPHLRH